MFIAEFETPNFAFMAGGNTKDDAVAALLLGVTAHCNQYRLPTSNRRDLLRSAGEDARAYELRPGQCLRDREDIVR